MQFRRALFLSLSALAAHAAAQQRLFITEAPSGVVAGVPVTIRYTAADLDQEATLILKQGNPGNLDTVSTLTSTATGGSFTWTPDETLPAGDDYALEIQQGGDVNYSGQFTYESDVTASAASSAASSVSSALSSVSASASSATSSVSASASSAASSISSALSSQLSSVVSSIAASLNASTSTTMSTTTLTGSARLSTGTGTAMPRNTTMSSPTLSSSTTTSTSTSTQTTTTGTSGSNTSTAGGNQPTGAAAGLASPLALVLGAFVAMIYLH